MLDKEVVVAPFFIARIDLFTKRLAQIAGGLVPVHGVFGEAVIGGHIKPAAKPPHRIGTGLLGNKEAHVGMAGRQIGVFRVDHQRHAHRFKAAACQLRAVRGGRCRHLIAMNVGEVNPCLLEYRAVAQHAASTAAAAFAVPTVFFKICLAVSLG